MSDVVISATGLGKRYTLGMSAQKGEPYLALRDVLSRTMSTLGRSAMNAIHRNQVGQPEKTEEFWALRDVSFEIKRGDVVGVIGRNGAGKSTLLKILSRITEPTTGRVSIKGRIASLLEVGTGFHPELTGRENVMLNGAILGMGRSEIRKKFDAIVSFAEVEQFLDTPVKRYSSGMYVRLAFAIAAHLEPEILVVDEVLAVGDAEFQKRCLGKMQDVASQGRTVLFVSHNMGAVATLCPKAIYLRRGELVASGATPAVMDIYASEAKAGSAGQGSRYSLGSSSITIESFDIQPHHPRTRGPVTFQCAFSATKPNEIREAAVLIYGPGATRVCILDLRRTRAVPVQVDKAITFDVHVDELPLVEGEYSIGLYVVTNDFSGNVLELATLSVQPEVSLGAHVPYPAINRGLLDLNFSTFSLGKQK